MEVMGGTYPYILTPGPGHWKVYYGQSPGERDWVGLEFFLKITQIKMQIEPNLLIMWPFK